MDIQEFWEDNKNVIMIVIIAFLVIILFFVCLGMSRSGGSSSSTPGGSSSQVPMETVDPAAQSGNVIETQAAPETEPPTTAAPAETETAADGTVFTMTNDKVKTTATVNFRSGPTTGATAYGTIEEGTEVERISVSENGWSHIRYAGAIGYISSDYVTKVE